MDHDRFTARHAIWCGVVALLCCCLTSLRVSATPAAGATDARVLKVIKLNEFALRNSPGSVHTQIAMLRDFADRSGLEIEWLEVFRAQEALTALLSGRGELSISALPADFRFDKRLVASEPIGLHRFRVVGKYDNTAQSPLELADSSLAVPLSSPMWPYLKRLQSVVSSLRLEVVPDDFDREDLLAGVSAGLYDAALLRTEFAEPVLVDFPRLKHLFDLSSVQPVSWIARADQTQLMERLNAFIRSYHTAYVAPESRLRRFEDVKERGVLRVITRLDGANYFLKRGKPAGFELGLARRFAARHGLRLEVLVGRDDEEVTEWLRNGVGDIVTTRINEQRIHGEPGFRMSRDYLYEASVLVSNWTQTLNSRAELNGKTLAAYAGSAHLEALEEFAGPSTNVVRIADELSLERVLKRVEQGLVDGTVIDAERLDDVLAEHPDLVVGMSIPNPYRYRWTLRGNDPRLANEIDEFLQSEYRNETYNVLKRQLARARQSATQMLSDISPFDELLQNYSARFDFDWRLIAAQMYQESKFNPNAVSHAGAVGLMQLMPSTAASVGVADAFDPESGIRGGLQYLDYLRGRFDSRIPMSERTWFALAAYNVGYDRVRRARNHARNAGLNPNRWFGNVEKSMGELSYLKGSDGCRCGQAVVYVRAIRSLYYAYRNLDFALRVPRRFNNTAG